MAQFKFVYFFGNFQNNIISEIHYYLIECLENTVTYHGEYIEYNKHNLCIIRIKYNTIFTHFILNFMVINIFYNKNTCCH